MLYNIIHAKGIIINGKDKNIAVASKVFQVSSNRFMYCWFTLVLSENSADEIIL